MPGAGINHRSIAGFSIKASRFAAFIGMVCLAGIIAFSGCDSRPIVERVTTVNFIICKTVKSEQTLDIEILLRPQDDRGHTIEAPGTLDASLWTQNPATSEKEELIHEWTGIQVTPESYEQNNGALILLQHSKGNRDYTGFYQPAIMVVGYAGYSQPSYIMEKSYSGFDVVWVLMEVVFTLDGKTLVCTKKVFDVGLTIDDKW